jgi:hypothetical protein
MHNEVLEKAAQDLAAAAAAAGTWVTEVQQNAARVANEAPSLIETARRVENAARKLERTAGRRMCIGVFGPSQSGKSYLVSRLCRPPAGKGGGDERLIADFAGREMDFIKEINPPGDKESTGLVTRFSTERREAPKDFPVALQLLSETDIVRILANSYLCDFDPNRLEFSPPPPEVDEVRQLLDELREAPRAPAEARHLQQVVVFDLFDYFARNFPNRTNWLKDTTEYWSFAIDQARRLTLDDRARLFSVLWGGIKEFTELYLRLTKALAQLEFAPEAYAAITALEPRARSIIDVDRIKLDLGTREDERDLVKVLAAGTGVRREAALPRAVLCALVSELHITLKNQTRPMFDTVDLLDFPGARSREKYRNIGDKTESDKDLTRRPRELFIRGKVAVLFQRYTEDLELASMLLCMPPSTAEVKDLGMLVREWIDATHGKTSAERTRQHNALFVVLTKSDYEFVTKEGEDEASRISRWRRRISASMIELYQRDGWLDDWNGKPFDNAMWLRNPGIEQPHLVAYKTEVREGQEVRAEPLVEQDYASSIKGELAELRQNFLDDREVTQYFREPGIAFDEMLRLNDGGVSYIVERASQVCDPRIKAEQLRGRLLRHSAELKDRFARFYDAGTGSSREEQLQLYSAAVESISRTLRRTSYRSFGHLLDHVSAHERETREVFLNVAHMAAPPSEDAPPAPGPEGGLFDDLERALGPDPRPLPKADRSGAFARRAVQAWVSKVRALVVDADVPIPASLDGDALNFLVEQLIGGVHRLSVSAKIANDLRALTSVTRADWDTMAGLGASIAANAINRVVCTLGYGDRPEADRPPVPPLPRTTVRRAFKPPEAFQVLPELRGQPRPIVTEFLQDWMSSFVQLSLDNIGYAHDRDITAGQNAALGRILEQARIEARLTAA